VVGSYLIVCTLILREVGSPIKREGKIRLDRSLSELEGCVLGLVWAKGPCTPYTVRKVFQASRSAYEYPDPEVSTKSAQRLPPRSVAMQFPAAVSGVVFDDARQGRDETVRSAVGSVECPNDQYVTKKNRTGRVRDGKEPERM
jgi:hypothetical protein